MLVKACVKTVNLIVATAPTVYGIETLINTLNAIIEDKKLQQHLPFTVLKPLSSIIQILSKLNRLQQHLPFTVLKLTNGALFSAINCLGCNSTYRLRY